MSITPLRPDFRIAPAATPGKAARIAPLPPVDALDGRPALSAAAKSARTLAAAPPVDAARVADLRARIASGTYAVDPARIADKMIALDLPRR